MKYLYKILLFFCNILLVLYNFSQNLPDILICIQHLIRFLFIFRYICRHFILLFALLLLPAHSRISVHRKSKADIRNPSLQLC